MTVTGGILSSERIWDLRNRGQQHTPFFDTLTGRVPKYQTWIAASCGSHRSRLKAFHSSHCDQESGRRRRSIGCLRHFSEQYFTCGHSRDHFFRQANGLPQLKQIFCGKSDFLMLRGITSPVKLGQKCFSNLVVQHHFLAKLVLHLDHHGHSRITGK